MFLKILQNSEKNIFGISFFNKVAGWKPGTVRSSQWRCSVKQGVLKILQNFTGKNLCLSLFLIKLLFWGPATLLKKTPTQVVSCKLCKLFKNNYFEEHLWMSNIGVFLWTLWIIQEHLFCRESTNSCLFNLQTTVYLVEQW